MNFLLFFNRFFSILTFLYPPPLRKLLFIWLLRISYITRTYLKLTRCTLTSRMYIPLHRKFREVQIPNLEETF